MDSELESMMGPELLSVEIGIEFGIGIEIGIGIDFGIPIAIGI